MRLIVYYILLCWLECCPLIAATPPLDSTAGRYWKMLQRKPTLPHLFERFYNAWDESKYGNLEDFLLLKTKQSGKAGIKALWLLARFYEKTGQDSKAEEIYDKLLKNTPREPNALLARAQLNFYAGEFDAVIADLTLALKVKMPSPELQAKCLRLLGQTQIRNGKRQQGIITWRKLLKVPGNDNSATEEDIVQLMLDEGMYDNALKMCVALRKNLPVGYRKVALGVRVADIYHLKNAHHKAVNAYAEVLNSVAGDSWIKKELYSRIERELKLAGDYPGLLKFYRARVKKYPGDIMARKRYALLLHKQGHIKAATVQFKILLKLTPLDYRNREAYLDLLVEDKQYTEALTLLNKLIKRAPNDYELLIKQAVIEHQAGNKAHCLKSLDTYLQHAGSNEYAWNRVAKLVNGWKYTAAEGNIYRRMTTKFPQSTDVREAYGSYLYRHGKKAASLKLFRQLATQADRPLLLRLTRSLIGLGESKVAYQIMRQHYATGENDFNFTLEMFTLGGALADQKGNAALIEPLLKLASSPQELARAISAIAMELKRVKASEHYLEQLKTAKKLSVNQQCLLIELEYDNGSTDVAMAQLNRALQNNPTSIGLNSRMLYYQKQQGNTKAAIQTLESLLKLEPRRQIQYLREIIRLYLSENNYQAALKWVMRWEQDQPSAIMPLMTEADIYAQSGKLVQALKILKKASFKFPENKALKVALTGYLLQNMDYAAVINIYWTMLEQEPKLAAKLNLIQQIAKIAQQNGSREQLVSRLRNRMKSNPESIFPLLALARVYKVYNDYTQYRYYLVKATEKQADNIELLYSLAHLDEAEGSYDKAEATLKKIVDIDKSDSAKRKLASFYFRSGEEDKGFNLLMHNDSHAMTPQRIKSTAMVMFNAGRYAQAADFLKQFVVKLPANHELLYLYALALEGADRKPEAIQAFIALLKLGDQLQNVQSLKVSVNSRTLNQNQYYNNLPPLVADIISMRQSAYNIYKYRNHNYRGYFGNPTSGITIPQTKKAVDTYVIVHLRKLSGAIGSKTFKQNAARLTSAGIRYADIKMALASSKFVRETAAWQKLIAKYADDINIIAVDCLVGMDHRQQTPKPEKYEKLIAKIAKKHPNIALLVFFSAIQRNVTLKKATLIKMVELLKTQPRFSLYMVAACTAINHSTLIAPAIKKQLTTLIVQLYLKTPTPAGHGAQMNYVVASLLKILARMEDYPHIIKLLQLSMRNIAAMPTIPAYMLNYYSRQGLKFSPLAFPPRYSGFAPLFSGMFQPGAKMLGSFLAVTPARLKKLWSAAKAIDNPALKLILADYCGATAQADKLAGELLNAKAKKSSLLALVAGYYGKRKNYPSALAATEQAVKLTTSKPLKKIYYAAAIYYAMQLKPKKVATRQITLLTGKLLRLRLTDVEKSSLAEALQIAGLTAEADKIDQMLLKQLTTRQTTRTMPRTVARRQVNITTRIKKLLQDGNTAVAMKLAYRPIKLAVSNEISSFRTINHNYYHPSWEAQQLIALLKTNKCAKAFLQQYAPGDDKSRRKQLEFAVLCQYFGETSRAIKLYRQLAAGDQGDKVAQMKLFLFYMLKDQPKAIKALDDYKLDKLKLVELIFRQMNQNRQLRNNPAVQFKLIDLISVILRRLPKDQNSLPASYYFFNVFHQLENQQYSTRYGRIPGVLTEKPQFKAPFVNKKIALFKQKQAVYQRYVDACMQLPTMMQQAFARQLTILKLQNKTLDEALFKQGVAVLKNNRSGTASYPAYVRAYSVPGNAPLVDPREFVINYALGHHKIAYLKQQFKNGQMTKLIAFADKLYHCPPAEFINLVNKVDPMSVSQAKLMLAVYRQRKLKVDLDHIILRLLEQALNTPIYSNDAVKLALTYLKIGNNMPERQLNFIYSVTQMVIKRYKVAYPNGMSLGGIYNSTQFNYHNFRLLNNLYHYFITHHRSMTLQCAHKVWQSIVGTKGFSEASNLAYVFTQAMQKMPLAGITGSVFVADLKDFAFMRMKTSNATQSMFVSFIRDHQSRDKKAQTVKFIAQLKPQTFGTALILAALQDHPKNAIFAVCGKYLADFKALAPARRQEFVAALKQLFAALDSASDKLAVNDPGYTFYHEYFAQAVTASLKKRTAALMQKRHIAYNYHTYLNDVNDLIGEIADQHPKLATKLIRTAFDRIRLLLLSGKIYIGHMTIEDIFMSHFLGYRTKKLAQLGIIYNFMLEKRLFNAKNSERWQRRLINVARLEQQNIQKNIKTTQRYQLAKAAATQNKTALTSSEINALVIEEYLSVLARHFSIPNAPMLFSLLYKLRQRAVNIKTVVAKYDALPEPLSRVQREIKLNLAYILALKKNSDATPNKEYIKFYLEFFNNPAIPMALKAINGSEMISQLHGIDKLTLALSEPLLKIYSRQQLSRNFNLITNLAIKLTECNVSASWRKVAPQVAAIAWNRYLSKKNAKVNIFYALALYCKAGNKDAVKQILAQPQLALQSQTYIILADFGYAKLCQQLFAHNWRKIVLEPDSKLILTHAGRKLSDEIIAKTTPADKQFFLATLFAVCRIGQYSCASPNSLQINKLTTLAEKFSQLKFRDAVIRQKCLIALAKQQVIANKMRPALLKLLQQLSPEELVSQPDKFLITQYVTTLKQLLAKNDYQQLLIRCKKFFLYLHGSKGRKYNNAKFLFLKILQQYLVARQQATEKLTLADLCQLADFEYRILRETGPLIYQKIFFRTMLLQSMTHQEKLTVQWIKQIPSAQRDQLQSYMLKECFSDRVTKDLKNHYPDYKPAVKKFLASARLQNVFTKSYQLMTLQRIIESITKELQ